MFDLVDIPNELNAPVLYYPSLDSTMAQARRIVDAGGAGEITGGRSLAAPGTFVVWSGHQTSGRGRVAGRTWTDEPDRALLVTIAMPRSGPIQPGPVAIRTGLAVADVIAPLVAASAELRVKWPNDVLVNGKKICGILIEAIPGYYLVGIGLNVGQRRLPPSFRTPATSIVREQPPGTSPPELSAVLASLLNRIAHSSALPWKHRAESLLARRGMEVRFRAEVDGPVMEGVVVGLGEDGALLLESPVGGGRIVSCYSGEVESL